MNPDAPTLSVRARRRDPVLIASWALVFVWICSSAASFWIMRVGDSGPSKVSQAAFEAIDPSRVEAWFQRTIGGPSSETPPRITVVHLFNPNCSCNRLVEPQLQQLMAHYKPLGVQFMAAAPGPLATNAKAPTGLGLVDANHGTLSGAGVISSPAALIFDARGRLVYYGPYSDSAWCGGTGALVAAVLERALSGLAPVKRQRASRGCFCGW